MEDYFSQHEDGLLSDERFTGGSATFRHALAEPGLQAYWLRQREVMIKAACQRLLAIGRHDARFPTSPSQAFLARRSALETPAGLDK
jgi:hypothetical protein